MTAADVERKIKGYTFIYATIEELQQQLDSLTYKTTSTLSPDAPAMSNSFHSKVEDYGNKNIELREKIFKKSKELLEIKRYIEGSGLSEHEKGILWYVALNKSLQTYARKYSICKSNVYKIKDRALKKITNKLQNV